MQLLLGRRSLLGVLLFVVSAEWETADIHVSDRRSAGNFYTVIDIGRNNNWHVIVV